LEVAERNGCHSWEPVSGIEELALASAAAKQGKPPARSSSLLWSGPVSSGLVSLGLAESCGLHRRRQVAGQPGSLRAASEASSRQSGWRPRKRRGAEKVCGASCLVQPSAGWSTSAGRWQPRTDYIISPTAAAAAAAASMTS